MTGLTVPTIAGSESAPRLFMLWLRSHPPARSAAGGMPSDDPRTAAAAQPVGTFERAAPGVLAISGVRRGAPGRQRLMRRRQRFKNAQIVETSQPFAQALSLRHPDFGQARP